MNVLKKIAINRRTFVKATSTAIVLGATGIPLVSSAKENVSKAIKIKRVDSNFEREPLNPYRFKGSVITDSWQSVALIETESGIKKIGLATQGVLWSDARVAAAHSESAGNSLMFAMTEHALQIIKGTVFTNPIDLLDQILPDVLAYGKKITGIANLRKTFALNALVAVDNAAWLVYAAENNISNFDALIPIQYRQGLSHKHTKVASIPSFSVGSNPQQIKAAAKEGFFIMKLKTGSAGTQKEMLEKDLDFLTEVHKAIGHFETPYTKSGKIPYYFDPNGRYEQKETLLRFLDHANKIGAFEQIALIEEPFPESNESYVGNLGVRIAADESAHTVEETARRIEQGYSAIVVKAIAKTLSMTLKIIQYATEKKIPCFCADLTVNPILVDWNKTVAARLLPFPGMDIGLQETNGHQYYKRWDTLMTYHPKANATWIKSQNGVYQTDETFYAQNGGIFDVPKHYMDLFSF